MAGLPVDARTDLFLLGLLLWECAVGSHPYAEQRPRDEKLEAFIERATLRNERRQVTQAAPGMPDSLATVIEALLQPPERRIPTAADLRLALERDRARTRTETRSNLGALVQTTAHRHHLAAINPPRAH